MDGSGVRMLLLKTFKLCRGIPIWAFEQRITWGLDVKKEGFHCWKQMIFL